MNKKYSRYIPVFFKGMAMGICDLIPGISGGTIAFITGIYPRLVNAVRDISLGLSKSVCILSKKDTNKEEPDKKPFLGNSDLFFLIILGAGIISSILLGSRFIRVLLRDYFAYTLSFFVGLILMSSKVIYDHIDRKRISGFIFGFIGLLVGFLLVKVTRLNVYPGYIFIFFGGFLAASAMFLPGISGAFILLILGLYEFMIDALDDFFLGISCISWFLLPAYL